MSVKAGDTCVQCKKGMLVYTGRDAVYTSNNTYQRILKCNNCSWEVKEDQVRKG